MAGAPRPRLVRELPEGDLSPYLIQHRDHPVDWYPYGPEAFDLATELDRPVLISIGYAACHWCHVMAHESFEDEAVAAVLNEHFISVKVDREERPDVDAVYMAATQAMTGGGGWPMTVFTTSSGEPFYAATYLPPSPRSGSPSFSQVLEALQRVWVHDRAGVEAQAGQLTEAVAREMGLAARLAQDAPEELPDFSAVLARVAADLTARCDLELGGFGGAPKFPRPSFTDLCLLAYAMHGDVGAGTAARVTLDAMAYGGLYDHVLGGFARYSVDAQWLVPHFEKMLSDQAQLALGYLHGYQVLGDENYAQVALETLEAVELLLKLPDGGYATSIDADAGGIEGLHVTLDAADVDEVLAGMGHEATARVSAHFGLDAGANFEGRIIPTLPGETMARDSVLEEGRARLAKLRAQGPQATRDDKVVLELNAMLALAQLEVGWAMGRPDLVERSSRLLDHLASSNVEGGEMHRIAWPGGRRTAALAADAAWFLLALTRERELTGSTRHAELAAWLADLIGSRFVDDQMVVLSAGASSSDLVVAPTEVLDGAMPSATAMVTRALLRHGALTGDVRADELGRGVLLKVAKLLEDHAAAAPDLVASLALADARNELRLVEVPELERYVASRWLPATVIVPEGAASLEGVAPGAPGAYLCHGHRCLAPVASVEALAVALAGVPGGGGSTT